MITKKTLENTKKLLQKHNQGHLLAFWEQLRPPERQNLLAQIENLDFPKIDDWVAKYIQAAPPPVLPAELAPAPSYAPLPFGPDLQTKYAQATELGKRMLSAGKVAAFVVAGGQATRLAFDGPKGNFPISPVKNKTLFRIFAETIAAVSQKYNTTCPWYIMTSPMNHSETIDVFRSNDYYDLNHKNIFIFQQGTMPNFSFDGKILLADKANIACAPDGHGGSLKALHKTGALEDMRKRGLELISYWQVDNPLVNILDPLFIGLHVLDQAEMSSKAVIKTAPKEKVGNFCLVDGNIAVIEYSDLADDIAEKRNPDGSLAFSLGSIAIHIISRNFVERLNAEGFSLPLHKAIKKIPHIDQQGNPVQPAEPNGVKLETFVFDALPLASKSIILQTLRNEEFAPTKNATGPDSIETTRQMMIARAADWLESAGVTIPKKPDGSVNCVIEIAPSFAVERNDVKAKLNQIPKIKPNSKIYLT